MIVAVVIEAAGDWATAFAALFGVLGSWFTLDAIGLTKESLLRAPDPAEDRVRQLVAALTESSRVIAAIEREVKARGELAERLQADVRRHQELLALNRPEVEAVAQTFRLEVRREGRRGFWISLLVNAIFFGLGVAVTLFLS